MRRVFSFEDFKDFRRITMDEVYDDRPCIVISAGTCGQASGANDIIRSVKKYILEKKIQDKISLRVTGCQGFCEMYPFIVVEPGKNLYPKLDMKDVPQIIDAALKGDVVEKLIYWDSIENKYCISKEDIPFYKRQTRVILSKNELIDPIRILDYVKRGGYGALEKVLENPDSDWIIQEVKRSGLRGRGGAGFPTGIKWEVVRESGNGVRLKFIVCNGDEGDPGAYMDRSLLESNPHSIIEGMIIAGIAIGSSKGIIYVRNEYPLAIKHLIIAIRQASEINILGEDILGTGLSFDIEIVQGGGAFVCGEETALIRSIEGKRGEPRQRPPYPADKGIWGFPTCINNVETLANIPIIINEGADEYAKIGVPGNTGTKIFSLVGKIKNTGLVEVPMGISIGEIIYDIGGGSIGKSKIKAVQTGGPSGGCIPASLFDLPIDYDSLTKAGSIMGSGGMIVMDENTCMVDVAKYFTKFLKEESCGKCVPCREGTQRMFEILNDITKGEGKDEDIFTLEELGNVIKDTSLCGLGQTSANPLLSTIRYFKNEYIEHIKNKRCRALVCKGIV
jgi:NADH-quinone oxidoreductase subunit F